MFSKNKSKRKMNSNNFAVNLVKILKKLRKLKVHNL